MKSKTNFHPYVIKNRLKEVKQGLKLPVPVKAVEVQYSPSSGGIEYYDYYDSIDEAIKYIEYLEIRIKELEERRYKDGRIISNYINNFNELKRLSEDMKR
jgi:hypothetical protein